MRRRPQSRMPVKPSSLRAYASGGSERDRQRNEIRRYIYESYEPVTRRGIARYLAIPINAVCGRVNELIKAGEVEVAGLIICPVTKNEVEGLRPTPLWHHREPVVDEPIPGHSYAPNGSRPQRRLEAWL
jgi:hypothetical protein